MVYFRESIYIAYAIHYAMQKLRYFLANGPFVLKTDNGTLVAVFLSRQEILNTKLQRWFDNLHTIDIQLVFHPDVVKVSSHLFSDAVSALLRGRSSTPSKLNHVREINLVSVSDAYSMDGIPAMVDSSAQNDLPCSCSSKHCVEKSVSIALPSYKDVGLNVSLHHEHFTGRLRPDDFTPAGLGPPGRSIVLLRLRLSFHTCHRGFRQRSNNVWIP